MHQYGIALILVGIAGLIFALYNRNNSSKYNKRPGLVILKEKEFLDLQLKFSVINAGYFIVYGIIGIIIQIGFFSLIFSIVGSSIINFISLSLSSKKGYIKYI